jgi:hypothetical protein
MHERFIDQSRRTPWSVLGSFLLVIGLVAIQWQGIGAQPAVQGKWSTLSYTMPINPVHIALLHTGKVLVVAGSGNVAAETNYQAAVWDPDSGSIITQPVAWDMFCNGMVVLPDGRALINGGTLQYDPFHGQLRNTVFDPLTSVFTDVQSMAHGRWYPTVTTLGDGRVMTFSGLTETGGTNSTVEIFTPGVGWSPEYTANFTPPLYPRMHLMPDGRVLYSGSGTGSRIFDPSTHTWSTGVVATTNYSGTRTYGTSVLLPLRVSSGYAPRVMIFGGGNPATPTTEILDLSAPSLRWQYGPSMSQPRIEMNATILPNGKVLALGGSGTDENASTASLNADLYDPDTNTFSPAGANVFPRLYHSGSVLLPDATVLLVGGNPSRGSYEAHMEIYSPAYLFKPDGTDAVRPAIVNVTPGAFAYGSTFHVATPDAADIHSVVLVRPGAQTHAFDMDQRLVDLSFTAGAGDLTVTAPPNGNVAPPGYYMLFIVNATGVPSVATFVQLSATIPNQPPTATITSPATNTTVDAGQAVSFSGTGTDPDGTISAYSWTFPGGNPASATVASPGFVTYSTPGTYVASFKVTDNGGLTSPTVTRTILVPDFSLAATPSTQTVSPGTNVAYTATVTAGTGFTGTVNFSVSGLPAGASGTFTPGSISTSGSTTLNVTTASSTPAGSYPLVITGTSGQLTHSATVTLVVSGDFTITVSPASRTINRGDSTTYTVTIAGAQGFTGTVNLSVSGVPKFATATFAPSSVVNSGSSVLTVSTKKQTTKGASTLTITGSSTGRVHSVNATLTVQ